MIAHGGEGGGYAGEQLVAPVPDPRHVAVSGWKSVDLPSVGGHDALHAETHTQHGNRACAEHFAADGEVATIRRMPGAGGEDDVVESEHVVGGRRVVLDHCRECSSDTGDQVDEIPGVGVVVVDDHDLRGNVVHVRQLSKSHTNDN